MLPLSVVIIAKNEANALKLSLPPLKDWAKEIIVVTNDCTDNTKEVAESLGATVIEHPWEGYGKQRNFAQSCAHEDWILKIDADEVISEELKRSIEEFFNNRQISETTTVGYCYRCNRYLGRWLKHFKDQIPLLLKREKVHWEKDVHEKLCYEGSTYLFNGILYHYTENSIQETLDKRIHYARLSANTLSKKHSLGVLMLKAIFDPVTSFLKCYFSRRCFLEKFPGFYYAVIDALYTFFKYTFAIELIINKK